MSLAANLLPPKRRATRSQFWNVQMLWRAGIALVIWSATLNPDGETWTTIRIVTTIAFATVVAVSIRSETGANTRNDGCDSTRPA